MNYDKLTEYIDSLHDVGVPGCDLIVCRDHQPIYRHSAGWRDAEETQPVREDDAYCLYSCTKVFTTCAVMQLIERGLVNLDDPVSAYLPEFAHLTVKDGDVIRPAKRVMTIRHLMSMQSGVDYVTTSPALREIIDQTDGQATTRQMIAAKAKEPLCFEPGADFLYSLSHDALGAVIEVVSGMRFSEYLKANIFDPLGLETIGFALKEKDMPRLCAQYIFHDKLQKPVSCPRNDNHYRLTPNFESGGAGLYCDVKDYITFSDALACGGVGANGARILSPEMIQLWSANQLGPVARKSFDAWNRKGYSYALGVRTRVDLTIGGSGAIGEFGWDGAAGSWTMIDPHNRLSAFYAMHVRNFGYCYDVIHPTLRTMIYDGLNA